MSEINVIIKAIENGQLILEAEASGPGMQKQLISWPLDKLPPSLTIGDTLSIKLESNTTQPFPSPLIIESHSKPSMPDQFVSEKRHKLLEELIN